MDFILLIPDLILKFKVILFSLLRNQFLFMVSTFIIAYFYLHTNLTTALEVSQPSFHKLIFGATGQSILSHCNSSTELICVSFLVCGSCFLFNYLTKSYVLKDADTITREHTEDRPIFGETPLLPSTAQRANLDREDLLTLVNAYNEQLFCFTRRIELLPAFDLDKVCEHLSKHPNLQYCYGLLFRDHTLLHKKLLPHINPDCITNFNDLPTPLNGKDFLSWDLVARINQEPLNQIVVSDLYGVVTERIQQVQSYNASIALVKIPDAIIAEAPIIGFSKHVLKTRTFDVPTSYTTLWDQYILPTYKFLISFF